MTPREIIYAGIRRQISISDELLDEAFKDWRFIRIGHGAICVKDNEIHCAYEEGYQGRWLNKSEIQRALLPILDKYGHVVTFISIYDEISQQFVERLGFLRTGSYNDYYNYILTESRYA